jgi:predicted nucleic acid-binding Zn ribbon protein
VTSAGALAGWKTTNSRPSAEVLNVEQLAERSIDMLWTIAVILIVLWLLGLVSSYTLGGFIHILLVLAIVVILVNLIQGRRAL